MDRPVVSLADQEGFAAVPRLEHRIAVQSEHFADRFAYHVLVLDDEDRLGATWNLRAPLRLLGRLRRFDLRQVDLEGRSLLCLARDFDVSTALLHDTVDCREPESCS